MNAIFRNKSGECGFMKFLARIVITFSFSLFVGFFEKGCFFKFDWMKYVHGN